MGSMQRVVPLLIIEVAGIYSTSLLVKDLYDIDLLDTSSRNGRIRLWIGILFVLWSVWHTISLDLQHVQQKTSMLGDALTT